MKIIIILISAYTFFVLDGFSQELKTDSLLDPQTRAVFVVVEKMPEYPGGKSEMIKFIQTNLKYPTIPIDSLGISMSIVVNFVVNIDGSLSDIKVIRSLNSVFDKEFIKVIEWMPKWIPGRQNGVEVPVRYSIPLHLHFKK